MRNSYPTVVVLETLLDIVSVIRIVLYFQTLELSAIDVEVVSDNGN
jgi:hypothetical protein